jgi:hypothetical protein
MSKLQQIQDFQAHLLKVWVDRTWGRMQEESLAGLRLLAGADYTSAEVPWLNFVLIPHLKKNGLIAEMTDTEMIISMPLPVVSQ